MTQKSAAQDQPAATSSSSASGSPAPAVPKLTEKQKVIWEMKLAGKKRAEIASALGISEPLVSKTLQTVRKKLGIVKQPGGQGLEETNPERFAAVLDAATEPEAKLASIRAMFKEFGLPVAASEAVLRRIRQKYFGAVEATRSLKSAEIVDALNNKIDLALRYMDDKTMAEASFRDLALGTSAMIEKRQLLRGEPTQIVSDAERAKLHELAPALMAEMRRRGLTVEGVVTEKVVEPS